jgi:uncharacterized protein YycO
MNYFIQKLYFLMFKLMKPLIVNIGKLYPRSTSKEHIFKKYYEIESCLVPGDVILTKSDGHVSNLVNWGYWKHAMVFVGGEKPYIIEAIGEGVIKRTLIEMLASKDRVVILRPQLVLINNENQMNKYVDYVSAQVGKSYDHSFYSFTQSSENSFYCSELVFSGINHGNPNSEFDLRNSFGIMTVKPMDLYNMVSKNKFEKILEISREGYSKFV